MDVTPEGAILAGMTDEERAAWWWLAEFYSWEEIHNMTNHTLAPPAGNISEQGGLL